MTSFSFKWLRMITLFSLALTNESAGSNLRSSLDTTAQIASSDDQVVHGLKVHANTEGSLYVKVSAKIVSTIVEYGFLLILSFFYLRQYYISKNVDYKIEK